LSLIVKTHRPGLDGLGDGLAQVGELIAQGMRDERIFAWARRAMWEAALPVNASPAQIAAAIYAKQREDMVFAQDPYATELMMSAVKLLGLDPDSEGIHGGDCDDNVIVLGSALMSVGIPVKLLVRNYPQIDQLHLMLLFDADPRKKGNWTCFDATSPTGACFTGYDGEMVADLEVGPMVENQARQFLVLGRPPFESLLGASVPPTGPTMDPGQGAAWLALLVQTKADLDASVSTLVFRAAQLDDVRASLSMPVVDPTPTGSDAPPAGSSPLNAYGQNFVWTSAALNAQAKLLQTAQFVSSVLADGISGARALYWQGGDLLVGAVDGDAYGVLLKTIPGSTTPVLEYVDLSTGQPTGQVGFGIAPIIIAAAVVAVSLAAAWGVTKICDYLSSAHRDDAMGKVAAGQQALVDAGKQTPEQAQAFVRAATDLVAAPPGGASSGPSIATLVAGVALGAIAGAAAAVVLPRVLSTRISLGGAPA